MTPHNIHISDYDYNLPDERIAKYPLAQRDTSKLLVYNKGSISHHSFGDISSYLPKGMMMVFNNTKVIQARIHFRKTTGALIEVFLLEPASPSDYELIFQSRGFCSWYCLVGNLKKWKEGTLAREIEVCGRPVLLSCTRKGVHGTSHEIQFEWNDSTVSFSEIIDAVGELPIPPYLNRDTEESDKTTYQTVYSKIKGSVAAPTAGLHFTDTVLSQIDESGIYREEVTLHVGAGTFKPVKSEVIADHDMHTEYCSVRRQTIEKLVSHDCATIAVGTTSVRTVESLYFIGRKILNNPSIEEDKLHVDQWEPYDGDIDIPVKDCLEVILDYMSKHNISVLHFSTRIIIAPGYKYNYVKMLVTNFHQPKSTLLLLVSAFLGGDWRSIYDYALDNGFRFLSYGDSSLLIPKE